MTPTANYGWSKPAVGADADTWGTELNASLDGIDVQLKAVSTASAAQAPFLVPSGFIGLWSGAAVAIPAGWLLCDGTNGTPNLKDRFIVGAGATYAVGAAGGATSQTPAITVAGHALITAELPLHNHGISDPGHIHTINDPGHGHGITDPGHAHGGVSGVGGINVQGGPNAVPAPGGSQSTLTATTGITVNSATNGLSLNGATTGISTQNAGGGSAHSHAATSSAVATLPPYYALCYIMKN
jgi:hypothetical protein